MSRDQGKFDLLGREWKFDAYFQHGETKSHEQLTNTWNTARMALAQDAVFSGGRIVCRSSLTNTTNGCVPINLGTSGRRRRAGLYLWQAALARSDAQAGCGLGGVQRRSVQAARRHGGHRLWW
jgi:hypothetical protein